MIDWIRLFFWVVIFLVVWSIFRKKVHKKRNFCVGLAAVIILIGTLTALIPMEHTIWRFNSSAEAFAFNHRGKVILALEGEQSARVIAEDGQGSYACDYVAKKGDKWCAFTGITKRPIAIVNDTASVFVYQFRNTEDYYITVSDHGNDGITVSDNRGTVFEQIGETYTVEDVAINDYTYYGYVHHIDESYKIMVDEEMINVIQ